MNDKPATAKVAALFTAGAFALMFGLINHNWRPRAWADLERPCSRKNSLAWFLVTCPDLQLRDSGRAVKLAESAIQRSPDNSAFLNTLGVARYRAEDLDGAIEALTKSRWTGKEDSFNYFFLAMSHWQRNDRSNARRWFDRGMSWMRENDQEHEDLLRIWKEAAALMGMAGSLNDDLDIADPNSD